MTSTTMTNMIGTGTASMAKLQFRFELRFDLGFSFFASADIEN
jgi:hypothetical protein